MTKIKVRNGESLEQALRRFNALIKRTGILTDYRDRSRHKKKSEVRREQKKALERKIHYNNLNK